MYKYTHLCTFFEALMWSIFEIKYIKIVYFSIIQDFASTDVDALIMERKKQVGVRFFECDLVSKSSHLSNLLKANGVC